MTASVVCPACGKPVDPLRAGHVAILAGAFRYFCDIECKRLFLARTVEALPSEVTTAEPPPVAPAPPSPALRPAVPPPRPEPPRGDVAPAPACPEPPVEAVAPAPPLPRALDHVFVDVPPPSTVGDAPPASLQPPSGWPLRLSGAARMAPSDVVRGPGWVLWTGGAGVLAGFLAPCMALLGPGAQSARLWLATAALAACLLRAALLPRDPSDVHPAVSVLSVVAVWLTALLGHHLADHSELALAATAGLVAAVHLATGMLVDRARDGVRAARQWIERRLELQARVVRGAHEVVVLASDVKSGEVVVVSAGETVAVDLLVAGGEAVVAPWLDAQGEVVKRAGDTVVAGARVVSGTLRGTSTCVGVDRAWVRLFASPRVRPDVEGPLPRWVRFSVERGVVALAAAVAALGFANGASGVGLAAMAAVAAFCVAGTFAVGVVALHQARGPIAALAHGIVYRDAASFDAAGRADIAVLCSRSTILLGAPEIVVVEATGAVDPARVLGLAAGASGASTHPSNQAMREAAREQGAPAESVRHASYLPGLGVTGMAPSGERLVVGTRALLLQEKVSVAAAEGRVGELEAAGRSVILVGLGGKLVGFVALQDRLRPGARAAVQRLLDAEIEPVLLSGEARETCETIGRALDIEHIRPEVLPAERGGEVRALAEGGHVVAVLGHPRDDAAALAASQVAVALGVAGSASKEWGVSLASDDVRDAARALAIAVDARAKTRSAVILGFAPALVAAAGLALGLVPLALAPIVALAGVAAAVVHARM